MPRETWLDVRRQGVGSSDAAAAVGLNPYQSQLELWMHKTGKGHLLPTVDPNDETSPMYWGTLLEPIVAAHYTKRTGNKVRRVNAVLGHPQVPWMLANIDREVVGASDVQILECKTAGINGARLWRDGVPEYIQLQVMHQLAVTGKQAADVAVLTFPGGSVSWKRSKNGKAFNTAAFEKDHPDLAKAYTSAKAGSRRFLLQEAC
jgi:putative phage-type endonuclease